MPDEVLSMKDHNTKGHRERIRERFLAGDPSAISEESLLELLLTYAIPQKDTLPFARKLLKKFGSLDLVLSAGIDDLCNTEGIKEYSATLIRLIEVIRKPQTALKKPKENIIHQALLFEKEHPQVSESSMKETIKRNSPRQRSGLIGKSVLKEAIEVLPLLPDTDSVTEVRQFLRANLHFSAEQTRKRNANYIIQRMFPSGHADKAIRSFAKKYMNKQELRDVCFYRFSKAEPLMLDIVIDLIMPAIGLGKISRQRINEHLAGLFPDLTSIKDGSRAIVETLSAGGIARPTRTHINFSYRDILIHSFAFIVHSEFPEPGMYDITKLEQNRFIKGMLWNPTRILPMIYELRNNDFISKVSEIDTVRQFTTKWTLEELVDRITK